jgi:hypothetical protein
MAVTVAVGNTLTNPWAAGLGWVTSLNLGNTETGIGAGTFYAIVLSGSASSGALTLNLNASYPLPALLTTDNVNTGSNPLPYGGWTVGSWPNQFGTQTRTSGCMGSGTLGNDFINGSTSSTVTFAGGNSPVTATCSIGDIVPFSWNSHEHWQLPTTTKWTTGQYQDWISNTVEAYDTLSNQTGPGLIPEDLTGDGVTAYDLAFIGLNYTGLIGVASACTTSNNATCLWGRPRPRT